MQSEHDRCPQSHPKLAEGTDREISTQCLRGVVMALTADGCGIGCAGPESGKAAVI